MLTKIPFIKKDWTISKNLLPKKYDSFEGSFTEKIDIPLLTLLMETEDSRITPVMKILLQKNIINYVKPDGTLLVTHSNGQYKMGRYRAKNEVSMIPLSKYIKHTMFSYLNWSDIDMVKGHPTIAYEMAKGTGLELPAIKNYIDNFDSICETLIQYYSLDENEQLCKDDIKFLFILMIYGGTFSTWKSKIAETDDALGYKPRHIKNSDSQHTLIQNFKFDCDKVISKIWKDNPNLKISLKGDLTDSYKIKSRVTSYWFQAIENHILDIVYRFLINSNIMVPKTCGLEYDGLNIPVSLSPEQKIQITTDVNLRIAQETNLDVTMKFKGYGDFVLSDLVDKRKALVIEDFPAVESDLSFSAVAKIFEETHFKVINKSFFCKKNDNGSVQIMGIKDLITSYAHIPCEKKVRVGNNYETKIVSFIREWTDVNPDIHHYTDLQIYPKKSSCPTDIYNLWIPFQAENIAEYVPNLEALSKFRNHISVLCNHNPDVAEFIEKWIAQMIQFPEIKNGCMPCFISDEGSGKGTLMALFHKMLGSAKVLETTDPERDVWGSFNCLMEQAFLVNLNEISTKNTMGSIGKIKGLITDPTIVINNKGIKQVVINSFHRFIMTTNCDEPITTKQGDRRTLVIRSSDEMKGNTKYFDELHQLLNDFNVVKTCFEFFKNLEVQAFDFKNFPETDYQNELKEKNIHVYQQWLRDFLFCDKAMHSPTMTTGNMFALFASWTKQNGVVFETSSIKMGLWFATHKFDGLTKTRTREGMTWAFDYVKLANVSSLKF